MAAPTYGPQAEFSARPQIAYKRRYFSFDWLSTFFGLDVYGRSTLLNKARIEMNTVALLLAIIFAFDCFVWTQLTFMIATSGAAFDGSFHPSLLLGIPFAVLFLVYERNFMVTSFHKITWKHGLATSLRFLVVFMGALITAQPLELRTFQNAIDARVREESMIREVVARVSAAQDARDVVSGSGEQWHVEIRDAKAATRDRETLLTNAVAAVAAARNAEAAANATLGMKRRNLQEAQAAARANPGDEQSARVRQAQQEVAVATSVSAVRARERATAESAVAPARQALQEARGGLQTVEKRYGEDTRQDLRNYVAKLRSYAANPASEVPQWQGARFELSKYDAFERLRVLGDLCMGRAAVWPEVSPEVRSILQRDFQFSPGQPSPVALRNATVMNYAYWSAFGLALIIPLMSFAYKLLLSEELQAYYHSGAQMRMGHPEATLYEQSKGGFTE